MRSSRFCLYEEKIGNILLDRYLIHCELQWLRHKSNAKFQNVKDYTECY